MASAPGFSPLQSGGKVESQSSQELSSPGCSFLLPLFSHSPNSCHKLYSSRKPPIHLRTPSLPKTSSLNSSRQIKITLFSLSLSFIRLQSKPNSAPPHYITSCSWAICLITVGVATFHIYTFLISIWTDATNLTLHSRLLNQSCVSSSVSKWNHLACGYPQVPFQCNLIPY